MDLDFWHQRWINNEIGFHQQEISAHLEAFWPRLEIPPGGHVFVPLCGKSRDMLWLRSQGFKVTGVEISPVAVEAFFQENALQPEIEQRGRFRRWRCDGLELLQGDFFDLENHHLVELDAVYDRASLVALPPAMRGAYARHLAQILPDSVPLLLVTLEYPAGQMKGPPFSVSHEEVRTLFSDSYRIDHLFSEDALVENPKFRQRGITELVEKVYHLTSRTAPG